ncbi:MAG: hypothetical protein AAF430_24015 [Myxococcota bacterium]
MKRRFGRGRRRGNSEGTPQPIDAAHWMARIVEVGAVPAANLEPLEIEGLPEHFAALGVGEDTSGQAIGVAFAPERGADAALAALALGSRRSQEDAPAPRLFAVAPDWSVADRRRLALLESPLPLTSLTASALATEPVSVAPETAGAPLQTPAQVAQRLERGGDREAFGRALAGLEGLAAKHGGALRGADGQVDLVVLARRCASLVAEPGGVNIEVYQPERASLPVGAGENLATALDRLEGLIRKLLNDRRLRGSEAAIRSALAPILERAQPVVARALWPIAQLEGEPIDWVGIDAEGRITIGASRERLGLTELAEILDGAALAPEVAAHLAREAGLALSAGPPRLVLAAQEFEPIALEASAALGTEIAFFDARTRRGGEWTLEPRPRPVLGEAIAEAPQPPREAREERSRENRDDREERPRGRSRRSRGSRGGRSRAGDGAAAAAASDGDAPAASEADGASEREGGRFEEVSLFDLDDEGGSPAEAREDGDGRRRRSRGRRRGRRGRGGESARGERSREGGDDGRDDSGPRTAPSEPDDEEVVETDDDETLAPLDEEAPDPEEAVTAAYEDEDDAEEGDDEADRARQQREQRRRARTAKPEEPPPAPRRRAAFLAHADPVSVLTAVVLARDVRLVESFWVYPQSDLMTFFRGTATELKDQTPIFLVGFAASPPTRDTIQTVSLYRGRLDWYDHHDWPPEDLVSLRAALGEDHVHVEPGSDSSLSAVISGRTRRSRFSDKLVELITGRFTQHDYERWGRWWWQRAQDIAARPGDRRAEIEPLLAGRPSDLAKVVADNPEPPLPPELAYVSERDFRLVHFGGLSMVVLEVPEPLDLHLAARIARERYESQLSLVTRPEQDLVILSGDDSRAKRGLDLGSMTAHLSSKHAWIEGLADDDHVARMRVHGLHGESGRFDELITEIAMGRSIVEG